MLPVSMLFQALLMGLCRSPLPSRTIIAFLTFAVLPDALFFFPAWFRIIVVC